MAYVSAQGPSSWFWGVALAWCRGQSIGEISKSIELADGDIVSTLNKTVDLMDQFRGMLTAYGDYALLSKLATARALLNRGMVAMIRSEGIDVDDKEPFESEMDDATPLNAERPAG